MPFITTSNSRKIIRNSDLWGFENIVEKLYKWDIYFFNKKEELELKALREFLRNPALFVSNYYKPIEITDSLKYTSPERQPSYHKDSTCPRLNSNFRNLEIPIEIRERGKEEVEVFRDWYRNTGFREENTKKLIYKIQAHFPYIKEINPKTIDLSNSGIKIYSDQSLNEFQNEIDKILRSAADYYKNNIDLQPIIKRYQKLTFLAYKQGNLTQNESGLNDDDLKDILRFYDESFKTPVKNLLAEYYKIQFNPSMIFDSQVLTKLGFKMCNHCFEENNNISFSPMTINN